MRIQKILLADLANGCLAVRSAIRTALVLALVLGAWRLGRFPEQGRRRLGRTVKRSVTINQVRGSSLPFAREGRRVVVRARLGRGRAVRDQDALFADGQNRDLVVIEAARLHSVAQLLRARARRVV